MPWKKIDVKKHKKGLSDAQEEKWVRIANGFLSACIKKGKKEAECAVSAIRLANSMSGTKTNEEILNFNESLITLTDIKIRTEYLDKRLHLVVPMIMLLEGVHNGRLYLDEDLSNAPESWNGRPIVVTHPKENGEPVSVNSSPRLVEKTRIGTIFNSSYQDKKLTAEGWIDVDRAMLIAPEILNRINNSKPLELSTGLWFLEEEKEGDWNGEPYYGIARHYKPDHVAFLPNEKGACSWKDGCGVRANEVEIAEGELSLHCIVDKLYQMVNVGDKPVNVGDSVVDTGRRLKEVYFDYFTFVDIEGNLYKQDYKVNKKGDIVIKGDPEKVKKMVSYEIAHKQEFNSSTHFVKEVGMDKKEKIDYILGTKKMGHEEKKRPGLEALSDEDLEWQYKMAENFRNCKSCNGDVLPGKIEDKTIATNQGEAKPKTLQEYIKDTPAEFKDVITESVRMHNERKSLLVNAIKGNKRNRFSLEKLNAMSIDEIETLVALAQVDVDFSGQLGGSISAVLKANERQPDGSGVPDAPEMKWGNKK